MSQACKSHLEKLLKLQQEPLPGPSGTRDCINIMNSARFTSPPGGGTPIWNRRGCSSEILNLTPKGDHLGVA